MSRRSSIGSRLGALRRYRDEVLDRSQPGRRLVRDFYVHSVQIVRILASDDALREEALNLLLAALPHLTAAVTGKPPYLGDEQREAVEAFAGMLQHRADEELKQAIAALRRELADPRVARALGFDVSDRLSTR